MFVQHFLFELCFFQKLNLFNWPTLYGLRCTKCVLPASFSGFLIFTLSDALNNAFTSLLDGIKSKPTIHTNFKISIFIPLNKYRRSRARNDRNIIWNKLIYFVQKVLSLSNPFRRRGIRTLSHRSVWEKLNLILPLKLDLGISSIWELIYR